MNRPCRSTVLHSLAAMLLSLSFGQQIFTPSASAQSADHFDPSPVAVPEFGDGMSRNIVACSADGKFFVLATPDGRLKYTRTADGVTLRTFGPGGEDAAQYELRPGRNRVGRGPGNDVVLDDESVSGHHGEIHFSVEGIRLRDLGSLNGTWIGGSRIEETPWRPVAGSNKSCGPRSAVSAVGNVGAILFWTSNPLGDPESELGRGLDSGRVGSCSQFRPTT